MHLFYKSFLTTYFLLGACQVGTQRHSHGLKKPTVQCGPSLRGQLGASAVAKLEPGTPREHLGLCHVHSSLATVPRESSLLSGHCIPWIGPGLWGQGLKEFSEPGYSHRGSWASSMHIVWRRLEFYALSGRLRQRS